MNNDLISREALKESIQRYMSDNWVIPCNEVLKRIDNAPTVENITVFCENADEKAIADMKEELQKVIDNSRPQGDLAEKLKARIEESICKRCQMNENCVLCKISRVFQIITLTMEEQKGGGV